MGVQEFQHREGQEQRNKRFASEGEGSSDEPVPAVKSAHEGSKVPSHAEDGTQKIARRLQHPCHHQQDQGAGQGQH